jgi:hypothetical protein
VRTLEGGNVHRQMMLLAKDYLEKLGYTVVLRAQVGINTGIIDVLGVKNGEKVAIECQILPSQAIMQSKHEKYKPYISKLMLAVPKNVTPHNIPAEIEVLNLDVEKPVPKGVKLTLTISKEADDLLHAQNRRTGDISRIVEELIIAKFGQPTG